MQMKLTHYIYISAALAMLTACGDDIDPVYTVGEADNTIVLSAGVVDGGATVKTRAGSEDNHAKHGPLAAGTKLRLQVSGTWTGHVEGGQSVETIVKETTASISDAIKVGSDSENTHNKVSFSTTSNPVEQLYWDDFGTADPANTLGRSAGLTIYAAAVNGSTTVPTIDGSTGKEWTNLSWTLDADQKTNNWSSKDLLISNNVKLEGADGCYKFDERANGKLLEFKHAMSKITINLTANKGFADSKFVQEPTVQLHGFYTSGNVDITTGALSNQTGNVDASSNPTNIITRCDTQSPAGQTKVTRSALVFPGLELGNDNHIATVTADGNIYKITSEKIYDAMTPANGHSDKKLKSGYNYILNITVNKTEVKVSATLVNWIDVSAAEDFPKIDVSINYGEDGGNFGKDFSFYYSANKSYISDSEDFYGTGTSSDIYGADRLVKFTSSTYSFKNLDGTQDAPVYWPDHNTKYFFRGIWPVAESTASDPKVKRFNNGKKDCQGIPVSNAPYVSGTYPSDLMIGIPLRTSAEDATHKTEPTEGISATEGTVSLTFTYRMAQVEVRLKSSGSDKEDNIDFGSENGAELAVVKIVNGYKDAYILMDDGSMSVASGASLEEYTMTAKSDDLKGVTIPTSTEYSSFTWNDHQTFVRHDAIIPQSLDVVANPVKFVITTGPAGNKDTYMINIKDIIVSKINNNDYNSTITSWEPGKHYIYTLTITKTKMRISATITDWVPVVAGGDFWL